MRPTANNDYQGPTVDAHPGLIIGPVIGTVAIALAALFYDTAGLTGVLIATAIIIACAIGTIIAARVTHRKLDRKLDRKLKAKRQAKRPKQRANFSKPLSEDEAKDALARHANFTGEQLPDGWEVSTVHVHPDEFVKEMPSPEKAERATDQRPHRRSG